MAAALHLLVDGPVIVYIAGFAIVTVLAEIFVRYSRYASVLRWLTLSLFAYVGTVFVVGVPSLTVAKNLVLSGSSAIAGFRPHRSHHAALPQWALQKGPEADRSLQPCLVDRGKAVRSWR
jgi:hypothetical protein